MAKPSLYEPDLGMIIKHSQCNKCKNKECYWSGDEMIKLYNCKNRKE